MTLERRLLAFKQGQGGTEALHRALAEHPSWHVLQTADGGFAPLVDGQGQAWLTLFHDAAALDAFMRATGYRPERVGRTPGYVAFKTMVEGLHGVQINPDTPMAIHFTAATHGGQLHRWGHAVFVERVLADPGMVEDPFAVYRDFRGYQLIVVTAADGSEIVAMAPDDRGRRLVAVFTANDTAQADVAKQGRRLAGTPRVLHFSGTKLFRTLRQRQHDGIVFNCCGPIAPRAFQPGFADAVLEDK